MMAKQPAMLWGERKKDLNNVLLAENRTITVSEAISARPAAREHRGPPDPTDVLWEPTALSTLSGDLADASRSSW